MGPISKKQLLKIRILNRLGVIHVQLGKMKWRTTKWSDV